MTIEDVNHLVETYDELNKKKKEIEHSIQEFNRHAKKHLIEVGPTEALTINWPMLRRVVYRGKRPRHGD